MKDLLPCFVLFFFSAAALPEPELPPRTLLPMRIKSTEQGCDLIFQTYNAQRIAKSRDEFIDLHGAAALSRFVPRKGAESCSVKWKNRRENLLWFLCQDTAASVPEEATDRYKGPYYLACANSEEVRWTKELALRGNGVLVDRAECIARRKIKSLVVRAGTTNCRDMHIMEPGEFELWVLMHEGEGMPGEEVPDWRQHNVGASTSQDGRRQQQFDMTGDLTLAGMLSVYDYRGGLLEQAENVHQLDVPAKVRDRTYRICAHALAGHGNTILQTVFTPMMVCKDCSVCMS